MYIVISVFYKENIIVSKHFLLEKKHHGLGVPTQSWNRGHNNLELVGILTNFNHRMDLNKYLHLK